MNAVIIIPARYGSTRFPGKALANLGGKPVIQWVYERAKKAKGISSVIVATDSQDILTSVKAFGGEAVLTSEHHASGTDRIAEVARDIICDIIINVQGDEPFIRPEMIEQTVELLKDERASISTLAKKIDSSPELIDPNVVKVAFDEEGFALYFSRSPVPYHRDRWRGIEAIEITTGVEVYKHIGIYGYRREVLLDLAEMPQSRLEKIEKLEQLRALEKGLKIKVGITLYETIGIDTPEDLARAERWLNSYS